MEFKKVNYKVEAYVTDSKERTLTENDIKLYYEALGYNVYMNYGKRIVNNEFKVSPNTIQLFEEYNNGYPDFLLVGLSDTENIKFVEVKLDRDHLRPNQIEFNNKLAVEEDVTIVYFNTSGRYENKDNINYISKFSKPEKQLIKRLDNLCYIQRKRGIKPYWVVAELYKEYGSFILKKKIIGIIAENINTSKKGIVWFVNNKLNKNNK